MKRKYAALKRAVDANDKAAVLSAIAKLSDHEKDLLVPCACGAKEFEKCVNKLTKDTMTVVHFGRRLKRLLAGIR